MKLIKTTDHGLMKFNTVDAITSKTIADALGVTHRNLLAYIKKAQHYEENSSVQPTLEITPMFKDFNYTSRGKSLYCQLLNEDAVLLLIKVVDSQEAYDYYKILLTEFKTLKIERSERSASKSLQRPVTDSLQELYLRLHNQTDSSQVESRLYTNFNKKSFKAVTGLKHHKDLLDTLDAKQACDLAELRDNAHKQLDHMLELDKPPKQIRANLWAYIEGFHHEQD